MLQAGIVGFLIVLVVAPPAPSPTPLPASDRLTGIGLLRWCDEQTPGTTEVDVMTCEAYVLGFTNGMEFGLGAGMAAASGINKRRTFFCFPKGIAPEQPRLVVVKWLRDHPAELHKRSEDLLSKALWDTWACPKEGRQ